jgi:hypothetical protein
MFGLVKRHYCKLYRLAQQERASTLLGHVDLQIGQWRKSTPGSNAMSMEADIYFHDYMLGILDSLTRHFENEARNRFGVSLHEDFFVEYIVVRFDCSHVMARRHFEAARKRYGSSPQIFQNAEFSGAGHGYADGLAVLNHVASQAWLLRHLIGRSRVTMKPLISGPPDCAANDLGTEIGS